MSDDNILKVGYAKVNITPMMGIPVAGYFIERLADGVLDNLHARAVALNQNGKTILMMAVDHCGLVEGFQKPTREAVSKELGVPEENIYIHATHTHTGPVVEPTSDNPLIIEYISFLRKRIIDAFRFAIADLKPAKMGIGVGNAPNIAFIRRYRMKDGSVKTNPGVNNPDIVEPIGQVDERVNVIRFDRENASTVVMLNFGDHPDTVGGCKISADWPGFACRSLEKAIDNVDCIFFNGAQGDVNHVKVNPTKGDFNGMFNDFDGVSRGYAHARYMGRVVAGAVMQVFDKVEYVDVDSINSVHKIINVPSNMPDKKDLPLAHKYVELHKAGRDDEIPFKAMALTTEVARAIRMVNLENGPEYFPMLFSVVKIGSVAFFGIPGEPFTGVGRELKKAKNWKMILPTCNTNTKIGYFPMQECYDQGGYETATSKFKAGVAEIIIKEGLKILEEINK